MQNLQLVLCICNSNPMVFNSQQFWQISIKISLLWIILCQTSVVCMVVPSWILLNPQVEFCINYFPTGDFAQLVSNSSRGRREDSRERMNFSLCWRNRRFVRDFVMYSCRDENSKIIWSGARGSWCLSKGLYVGCKLCI
jgi:hypothetical protein